MTPEEFEQSEPGYQHWNKYEFAEAYAEHENKALQKKVEELKEIIKKYTNTEGYPRDLQEWETIKKALNK